MRFADKLQQASFRGVPFHVKSRDLSGGRRIATDDIPRASNPVTEDMGGMPEGYRVDAFLVGDDCMERADLLVERLAERGAGRYVDPWLGERWVHVVGYRRAEARLREVTFSLYFQDAHDGTVLETSDLHPESEVDGSADALGVAAEEDALGAIDATGPEFQRSVMADALARLGNIIEPLGVFSDLATEATAQADRVTNLINTASTLATSPVDLVSSVRGAINGIAGSFNNALDALYAYETLFGVSRTTSQGASTSARTAERNEDAVLDLARQEAAAGAARAAVRVEWDSRGDAIAARERILAEIDDLSDTAGDATFLALEGLRATLVDMVPAPGQDLPYTDTVVLQGSIPAIVLSYREYGTIAFTEQLARRNKVPHPGFMPQGVEIEVLREA
jgi:prophage DNA circulation protein